MSEILLQFGAFVGGYALPPKEGSVLFSLLTLEGRMQNFMGDIRDLSSLKKALLDFQPDIVIHMAAQPLVLTSYREPVYTYETNVMGTVHVLEAVRKCPSVRSFLNVTTDKVYENKEWIWGYREVETLCGQDPYSNSKSCSELATYSYRRSFFEGTEAPAVSTARSGNVIGGGDFAQDRLIPDCVRAALNGEDIMLRNPRSIRPFQHVLECLYGYLLLAMRQYEDKGACEGSYNFGPDEESCVSAEFLADTFCRLWGKGLKYIVDSANSQQLHEANILKLDCSKARTRLGWRSKWDIDRAVEEVVTWTRLYSAKQDVRSHMDAQIDSYFEE